MSRTEETASFESGASPATRLTVQSARYGIHPILHELQVDIQRAGCEY